MPLWSDFLARRRNVSGVGRLEVRNREADFLDKTSISLSSNDLEFNEHPLGGLHIVLFISWVNEWASKDLVHNRNSIDLIAQDVSKDVIRG